MTMSLLVRYEWFASGYIDKHPGDFKTIDEVYFDIHMAALQVGNCDQYPFIRYRWCNKILHFNQFFSRIPFSLVSHYWLSTDTCQ